MKNKKKDKFEIELEMRTRKKLIKYVTPIAIVVLLVLLMLLFLAGSTTKLGIIGYIVSQMPWSIIIIVLYIAIIPFFWFISKKPFRDKAYEEFTKDISKTLVDRMLVQGEAVEVNIIKARANDYGEFVMELQCDKAADFFAVLGERDNLISIYAILKGEDKKRLVEYVSKEEFTKYYQLLDSSETL